ncbi:MAG: hypothetical protein KDA61_12465 [Planctomycetales bacterium]|nr:hypothetical protein [Planctomycetales bacterium]
MTNALLVDACVGPSGSLVLATHSGGPDWGSGPNGVGKLFRVDYDGVSPQPVRAWARRPNEVHVAFDRPIDAATRTEWTSRVGVEGGRYVAAGDRFEAIRPGYAVVERQVRTPRFSHGVHQATFSADHRTLVLSTAPHRAHVGYAVTLGPPAPDANNSTTVDVAYDLHGVEAVWQAADASELWSNWLPHVDFAAARSLTAASADHQCLWAALQTRGTLRLRTRLDLKNMLHPAVQPGASLDFAYPEETVDVVVEASRPLNVLWQGRPIEATPSDPGSQYVVRIPSESSDEAAPALANVLEIHLACQPSATAPHLSVAYRTSEDARLRALPLRRFSMPWAPVQNDVPEQIDNRSLPELAGGDWQRGREIFYGDKAACSKCHLIRGEGGKIGPNLSNLPQRDYASVLRDITDPNYALNPDFVSQVVVLETGKTLTGPIRADGDTLWIGNADGVETPILRSDVESIVPASTSLMPKGIPEALGSDAMRDLLTFLLNEPQ